LSSTINSFSYIFYYFDENTPLIDGSKCRIQAFVMIWFEHSQLIWAMLIGFSIYESIVISKDDNEVTGIKRIGYLLFGFGLSLIFSLLSYFLDLLGPIGNWCWIGEFSNKPVNNIKSTEIPDSNNIDNLTRELELSTGVRVATGLLILFSIIVILLNWFFIYSTIKSLNTEFRNSPEEKKIVSGYINKISLFPLIQTICMLPSYLNKFFILFQLEYKWLTITQTLFVSSQGLFYALIYGCNTKVKSAIRETIHRRLFCKQDERTKSVFTTDEEGSQHELNKSNRMIDIENYK
jgi:hypothetical protein